MIVNSVGIRNELVHRGRVDPQRIKVIHNFGDFDHFRLPTEQERVAARDQWQIPNGRRALLLPGRLSLQKHQVGLLLALRELARDGRLPADIVLLLAGRQRDPRISAWVTKLAQQPDLAPHVRLLGAQRDVRSLYWASDLLVLPSLWEGLPNASLEAHACGLPVLATRAANLDGVVKHGETGLEVPTADRAALATALAALLALKPQQLQAMGRLGRDHVVAEFAPQLQRDKLVQTYEQLLVSARHTNPR